MKGSEMTPDEIKSAIARARREALEEAAQICRYAEDRCMVKLRRLEKPNADLAGAAMVGAADMAQSLARSIHALAHGAPPPRPEPQRDYGDETKEER
jgi:hypothetical protein